MQIFGVPVQTKDLRRDKLKLETTCNALVFLKPASLHQCTRQDCNRLRIITTMLSSVRWWWLPLLLLWCTRVPTHSHSQRVKRRCLVRCLWRLLLMQKVSFSVSVRGSPLASYLEALGRNSWCQFLTLWVGTYVSQTCGTRTGQLGLGKDHGRGSEMYVSVAHGTRTGHKPGLLGDSPVTHPPPRPTSLHGFSVFHTTRYHCSS